MKTASFFSALIFTATVLLPFSASATSIPVGGDLDLGSTDILHSKAKLNRNLTDGDYAFAKLHTTDRSNFLDEWKFTLAENSDVSITVLDLELPLSGSSHGDASDAAKYFDKKHFDEWCHQNNSDMLLDNKFLTFSLFDHSGNLLGTAADGGTLSVQNLLAGEWYTLTVSAKINGIFGSAYHGNVEVEAVPLGDSLPLFSSALLLLAIRARKRISATTAR
jgi:hypothetical protein